MTAGQPASFEAADARGGLPPELTQVSADIGGLAARVASGQVTGNVDSAVRRLFNGVDIWGALETRAGDHEGLRSVLASINDLEAAAGGQDAWGIMALRGVNNPAFTNSLHALVRARDPSLYAILDRAVEQEPQSLTAEAPLARFIEATMAPRYGYMVNWKNQPNLPPFLQRLTERPYYARACLDSELALMQELADPYQRIRAARDAEYAILEDVLGLDADLSREYRLAIQARTLTKKPGDPHTILAPEFGGGLEVEDWHDIMRWYIDNFNELGIDRVKALRADWGIINLHRYGIRQLERMCRLSESIALDGTIVDPEFLEHLQNSDTKMVVTDRYGDPLDACEDDIKFQEDDDDTTLFTEAGTPIGFYLPFVRLRHRYGVVVSTVAGSMHGIAGSSYFGIGQRQGLGRYFDFGIADYTDPDSRYDYDNFYDVRDLSIAQFFHEYTQPHSVTGERTALFLACRQAARLPRTGVSTAEALVRETNPADRVVGIACESDLSWNHAEGCLWEYPEDRPARMHEYRKIAADTIQMTVRESQRRGE